MQIHEKLAALQDALGIKNAALARAAGVDAASISRYLFGKRPIPAKHLPMLCTAVARLLPDGVDADTLPPELRTLTGGGHITPAALTDAVLEWLGISPDEPAAKGAPPKLPSARRKKPTLKAFGEKLTLLMDLLGVSGTQLANTLHVDPSLIYKYRMGVRSPSLSGDTVANIAAYLCARAQTPEQRRQMMEAAGYDSEMDEVTPEDMRKWIENWLLEQHAEDTFNIEAFLESVDMFTYFGASAAVIPLEEIAPLAGDVTKNESFWGIEGMRDSATRYLYYAATLEEPVTLCICTSSSLDFLTGDPYWKVVWGSLMVHCLLKGHTIKIIYNMADRSVAEIMDAIEAFVPLYMVGNMEPYTFKKAQGSTMRNTLYLIENHVVVTASYADGLDDEGEYIYSTNPRRLAAQKKQFDALLAASANLMTIYRSPGGMDGFHIRLGRFWNRPGDASLLLPSLSLSTMPEALLESVLDRAGVADEVRSRIMDAYAAAERWLYRQVSAGRLDELSVVASERELSAGEVFLDIPPHLLPELIAYTPEEYAAHLARIHQLENELPNYRFLQLPTGPFRNIKVFHKSAEVIVQKLGVPAAVFAIENIHMCQGFAHFLSDMKSRLTD